MQKPVAVEWFQAERAGENLMRIWEPHIEPYLAGRMWLMIGAARALLIDCGTGMRPLAPFVASLTDLPVTAVALNCFYDHAGGLHEFDRRLAHVADAATLATPTRESSAVAEYVSDVMLLALSCEGYSTRDYRLRPTPITAALKDGDVIDLGGRSLEVVHTPGVTSGSICLWEEASGGLFTSDTLFLGPEELIAEARDRDAFRQSLARLSALPVTEVFPGHYDAFGRPEMDALIARYF